MAQYRVLEVSFIDNSVRQPGDIVEFDGAPSTNLEPVDSAAKKAAKAAEAAAAAAAADPAPADPNLA
jgi:hypothetical protein